MNKRMISILLVLALILSILVGCTKQDAEEPATSDEEMLLKARRCTHYQYGLGF